MDVRYHRVVFPSGSLGSGKIIWFCVGPCLVRFWIMTVWFLLYEGHLLVSHSCLSYLSPLIHVWEIHDLSTYMLILRHKDAAQTYEVSNVGF